MVIQNKNIYKYGIDLMQLDIGQINFPVSIGFFLRRNIKTLIALSQEIEEQRLIIVERFGKLDEDLKQYRISSEFRDMVQQELDSLGNIEQDVSIHTFKLSEFEGIELTYEQLDAIAFMIEE